MRLRRKLALATAVALFPSRAAADPRLVAIATDATLTHAIEVAVSSWHVHVVTSSGPVPPAADSTSAIRTAHPTAREAEAQAVVWLSLKDGATALWIYDPRTHQATVRALEVAPPFDEASAAAVALSVRTVLHDILEPKGGPPLDDDTPAAESPAPSPPRSHDTLRLLTLGALRVPTHATDIAAWRVGLDLAFFPSWSRGYAGLALSVEAGPSVFIERSPLFIGTYSDTNAALSLRGRIPLRPWLSLEGGAGFGVHATTIEGSSSAGDLSGSLHRVDASLEGSLALDGAWRALRFGPLVGGSLLLHYQRYSVGSVPILEVPAAQLLLGLHVGVELP